MMTLGLTGSIATGKSTVARQFAMLGVKVHDADAAVHALLAEGGAAVEAVAKLFPKAKKGRAIDRAALAKTVFADKEKLSALEAVLHPLVMKEEKLFQTRMRRAREKIILLDIPLLFETRAERRVDRVVTTWTPPFLLKIRALKRANMTEEKLRAILAQQTPQHIKRARADFVVPTGLGMAYSFRKVKTIVKKLKKKQRSRDLENRTRKNHARDYTGYRNDGPEPGRRAPHR